MVDLGQVRLDVELGVEALLGGVLHLCLGLYDAVEFREGVLVATICAAALGDLGELLHGRHVVCGAALHEAHQAVGVVLFCARKLGKLAKGVTVYQEDTSTYLDVHRLVGGDDPRLGVADDLGVDMVAACTVNGTLFFLFDTYRGIQDYQ